MAGLWEDWVMKEELGVRLDFQIKDSFDWFLEIWVFGIDFFSFRLHGFCFLLKSWLCSLFCFSFCFLGLRSVFDSSFCNYGFGVSKVFSRDQWGEMKFCFKVSPKGSFFTDLPKMICFYSFIMFLYFSFDLIFSSEGWGFFFSESDYMWCFSCLNCSYKIC